MFLVGVGRRLTALRSDGEVLLTIGVSDSRIGLVGLQTLATRDAYFNRVSRDRFIRGSIFSEIRSGRLGDKNFEDIEDVVGGLESTNNVDSGRHPGVIFIFVQRNSRLP